MTSESPEQRPLTPETIALAVLGWILQDQPRADRLLDLTGLTPDILREQLRNRRVLASVLEFLTNYEPDLIAAGEALQIEPAAIVTAQRQLSE